MKEIQDRLGAIHDRADLGARLHELAAAARRLEDGRLVIGYEALARLVEDDRRALLAGFARQHAGVAHPAFVPPARPEFLFRAPDGKLANWDVSSDAQRILLLLRKNDSQSRVDSLLIDWPQLLRE